MTSKQIALKHKYLNKHIFHGLNKIPDVNNSSMVTFTEVDFSIVLERVKANSIGIYGIEVELNNEHYDLKTYEQYDSFPKDEKWFTAAFKYFQGLELNLRYSASYYIGSNHV